MTVLCLKKAWSWRLTMFSYDPMDFNIITLDNLTRGQRVLTYQEEIMQNQKTVVAQAIDTQSAAVQSGRLFAQSEINAGQALEIFARAVGDKPNYEGWERERLAWVNGYVEEKPKAKGDAAYQAFGRFKTRLIDAYAIEVPKATSAAAEKKRAEREAKQATLMQRYQTKSDDELHSLISQAYERQARNPLGSEAIIKELKTVLKARTKGNEAEAKAELKAAREAVIKAVRACSDMTRLNLIIEMLDEENEVSFTAQ